MHREEEAAAAGLETPPGGPAGTMLACLTRGNLLDVLQEGFNEVTVCPSHSPGPLALAPPASAPGGVLLCPHLHRDPRTVPPQSSKEAKVVGTVLSSLVE